MSETSTARDTQFHEILRVIEREGLRGEELTASQIHEVAGDETSVSSAHEVATVLGYHSNEPVITVKEGSPYKYKFH